MIDPEGRRVYVCEPYHMPDPEEVIDACRRHGLECRIRAASVHYPGHTIRLEWRRKEGATLEGGSDA